MIFLLMRIFLQHQGEEGKTIVSFAHKNNFDLFVIGSRICYLR